LLKENWITYAGTFSPDAAGTCKATAAKNTFCDAIIAVKKLMNDNYMSYRDNFNSKCTGSAFELTDDLMIAHVYGWTPFNESTVKDGCAADFNLLQETPGYKTPITTPPPGRFDYSAYMRVKQLFDLLNYDRLPGAPLGYTFNPWVKLIHDDHYINAPNVYAYSVDDAVGNIQAEGLGFIIDIGGLQDLENQRPADSPININYSIDGPKGVKFTHYRVSCSLHPDQNRPVRPFFQSFIINANQPDKCPIFFLDNKFPSQLYTFKLTQEPPYTLFTATQSPGWDANTTAKPVDCLANAGAPPFKPSSRKWCCELLAMGGNGVYAFSQPEPFSAHKTLNHNVQIHGPEEIATLEPGQRLCNGGRPITTPTAPLSTSTVRRR
jgi:hypothetical protein